MDGVWIFFLIFQKGMQYFFYLILVRCGIGWDCVILRFKLYINLYYVNKSWYDQEGKKIGSRI